MNSHKKDSDNKVTELNYRDIVFVGPLLLIAAQEFLGFNFIDLDKFLLSIHVVLYLAGFILGITYVLSNLRFDKALSTLSGRSLYVILPLMLIADTIMPVEDVSTLILLKVLFYLLMTIQLGRYLFESDKRFDRKLMPSVGTLALVLSILLFFEIGGELIDGYESRSAETRPVTNFLVSNEMLIVVLALILVIFTVLNYYFDRNAERFKWLAVFTAVSSLATAVLVLLIGLEGSLKMEYLRSPNTEILARIAGNLCLFLYIFAVSVFHENYGIHVPSFFGRRVRSTGQFHDDTQKLIEAGAASDKVYLGAGFLGTCFALSFLLTFSIANFAEFEQAFTEVQKFQDDLGGVGKNVWQAIQVILGLFGLIEIVNFIRRPSAKKHVAEQ